MDNQIGKRPHSTKLSDMEEQVSRRNACKFICTILINHILTWNKSYIKTIIDEDKSDKLRNDYLTAGVLREVLNNRYWDIAQFFKVFRFASGHVDLNKSSPVGRWWAQSKHCHIVHLHYAIYQADLHGSVVY